MGLYENPGDEGYRALAHAIVIRAAADYKAAVKRLKRNPKDAAAKRDILVCGRFFLSERFEFFSGLNGEAFLLKLNRTIDEETERKERRNAKAKKKKRIKGSYLAAGAVLIAIALVFSGCGNGETRLAANAKGDIKVLTVSEIYDREETGFYVKQEEEGFSPVLSDVGGFDGEAAEWDRTRFLWWPVRSVKNRNLDYGKLVPAASPKKPLCLFAETAEDMPETITLERYVNKGYTVGGSAFMTETGDGISLSTEEVCEDSEYADLVDGLDLGESMEIARINDLKELPVENVDTDINKLLGLEREKYYKFRFRVGTRTKEADLLADTRVLKSKEVLRLGLKYKQTSRQYFEILLPDNLERGWYYINDAGLFRYETE